MRNDLNQHDTSLMNRLPRRLRALGALLLLTVVLFLSASPAHAVSASYSFVRTWGSLGSGDANFDNPTGITSDGISKIYVADRNNRQIKVFDKAGTLLQKIPSSGQLTFSPWGIGYDAGYLFVSDGTSAIYKLSAADGSYAGQINIVTRRGFAVGAGRLYVVRQPDGALLHYSTDGIFLDESTNTYPNAEGLTLSPGGDNLYVADTYNDLIVQLFVYDNSYTWQGTLYTGMGSRPSSIAIDQTFSKFYVSLIGSQTIRAYNTSMGNNIYPILYEWGGQGSSPGQVSGNVAGLPLTTVLDDPYVADDGNHRIQQFTEGIHTILQTGSKVSKVATDDGATRLGRAWPRERFSEYGGIISDKLTGLQWAAPLTGWVCEKCVNSTYCEGSGCCGGMLTTAEIFYASDLMPWPNALEYPICLNATGSLGNNWRLPNINELLTLVNREAADPGAWLRTSVLNWPILSQIYYSSTVNNSNNREVQAIDFATGLITNLGSSVGGIAMPVRTAAFMTPPLNPPYRTGQDSCFPLDLDGGTVPCPLNLPCPLPPCLPPEPPLPEPPPDPVLAMQDGAVKAGIPWPQPRVIDVSIYSPENDLLFDALAGLVWLKSNVFPCSPWGEDGWAEGHQIISCLNQTAYMGQTNWRMPNISELESLRHLGSAPTPSGDNTYWLREQGFSYPPFNFWSSTLYPAEFANNYSLQIDLKNLTDRSTLQNLSDTVLAVFGGELGHGLVINNNAPVTSSQQVVLGIWPPNPAQINSVLFSSDNKATWTTAEIAGLIPYTLPPEDGQKTVWVRYGRLDGSTDDFSASITLDSIPPMLNAYPNSGTYNKALLFSLDTNNEPARIYYRTDGTAPNFIDGLPNSSGISPVAGAILPTYAGKVLKYNARDAAGNWSPTYTRTYYLDTTLPSGSATLTSLPLTNNRMATFALSATDNYLVTQMRFSEDLGVTWTVPEAYAVTKNYTYTSPGDGDKCVLVQFMDEATNWSDLSCNRPGCGPCINLDSLSPLTTVSHTNIWYNSPVKVTLTCNDQQATGCSGTCTPSGCQAIYYTIDGSNPVLTSPNFIGSSDSLQISTDTNLRYAARDAAGNMIAVNFPMQQFRFDSYLPSVAIAAPAAGVRLAALPSVSGSADDVGGSNLNRVEIRITDGTNYVKSDQTIGPGETRITLNQANGKMDVYGNWSFATSSVPWTKPGDYTITARAYDNAGNVSADASRSFSIWNLGDTATSFILTSQSIKNGAKVSVRGKLTRIPEDPAYHLIGQAITITVTDPLEYGPPLVATYSTTTTDNDGHFQLDDISGLGGFSKEGSYTVTASFTATPVLTASSASLPVLVGATAGYAIIVEGKLIGDPESTTSPPYHNRSHSKTAQRVYEALKSRGFADMDIYNLNYDSSKPGVDAAPDKALIQSLLTTSGATYGAGPFNGESTIVTKIINNPGPLYIVLVDHGDPDKFYIDTDSATVTITPTDLKGWLETFEQALAPYTMPSSQKRIIINGSCYSGSFIPSLSAPGRIIITSAAANEQSFKGAMEADNVRSGEFFLEEFFIRLKTGDTFKAAFDYASDKVRTYTRSGSANSASAPYFDTAIQHPLLDDDASGAGSNSLSTANGDGIIASGLYLGFANDTTNASNPASILTVTDTVILTDTSTAILTATTANYAKTLAAWVEIRNPEAILSLQPGNKTQLDPSIAKTLLTATDPNGSVSGDEYFRTTYDSFSISGMYEIYYYAQESVSGQPGDISPMKRSVVYRNYPDNSFPAENSFNLVSPANNATLQPTSGLIFEWGSIAPSSIPANNSVTYTLEIADNPGFTNNGPGTYYKRELIVGNSTIIGSEAGLKPLILNYYWKVTAVDHYGAIKLAANGPFTFGTDNGNINQITAVTVKVYDSATLVPVNDAVVRVATTSLATSGNTCTTGKLSNGTAGTAGECSLAVNAGTVLSLEATKPALYQLKAININAPVTDPPPVPIPLTSTALPPLKINGSYYTDLSTAYTAASAGSTIQLKAQTFTGPFVFSSGIAITLAGGYDASYSATRTGYTELTGPVTISGGQVTMDRVVVK